MSILWLSSKFHHSSPRVENGSRWSLCINEPTYNIPFGEPHSNYKWQDYPITFLRCGLGVAPLLATVTIGLLHVVWSGILINLRLPLASWQGSTQGIPVSIPNFKLEMFHCDLISQSLFFFANKYERKCVPPRFMANDIYRIYPIRVCTPCSKRQNRHRFYIRPVPFCLPFNLQLPSQCTHKFTRYHCQGTRLAVRLSTLASKWLGARRWIFCSLNVSRGGNVEMKYVEIIVTLLLKVYVPNIPSFFLSFFPYTLFFE